MRDLEHNTERTSLMRASRTIGVLACIGALHAWAASGKADLTITFTQSGSDVVEMGTGTLNLSALSEINGTFSVSGSVEGHGSFEQAIVGPSSAITLDGYDAVFLSRPNGFGSGFQTHTASSGSGQAFGVQDGGGDLAILVPTGYTSNTSLSGSSTFTGQTLASLGLTAGTYTYTWGTGANADSLTVQIGPAAAVPEPSTFLIAGLSGAIWLAYAWRRQRCAAA